jgi:hypothetical protein
VFSPALCKNTSGEIDDYERDEKTVPFPQESLNLFEEDKT